MISDRLIAPCGLRRGEGGELGGGGGGGLPPLPACLPLPHLMNCVQSPGDGRAGVVKWKNAVQTHSAICLPPATAISVSAHHAIIVIFMVR